MSESVSIAVTGMKCGGCENTVKTKLTALDGVIAVQAFHQDKRVDIEFEPSKIDVEDLEDAIIEAGFSVD